MYFQTCVVRAWDPSRPLLFAPAMNTYMWDHPLTGKHVRGLKELGYTEIPCICKKLACGDTGKYNSGPISWLDIYKNTVKFACSKDVVINRKNTFLLEAFQFLSYENE